VRSTKLLLSAAALSTGLIFSGGTRAEDWKVTGDFGWFGVGKVFQLEKGHIYWVGEFSGTFANDKGKVDHTGWKCPGSNDMDLTNKKSKATGYCIISDPSGDLAHASWQCQGDTQTCNGPSNTQVALESIRASAAATPLSGRPR
jgi:hypothetical protein